MLTSTNEKKASEEPKLDSKSIDKPSESHVNNPNYSNPNVAPLN